MSIEAMKQARDFISRLKFADAEPEPEIVMAVLDQAIAEAEKQEPVAWMYDFLNTDNRDEVIRNWTTQDYADIEREKGFNVRPLYTHPPKKQEPHSWYSAEHDEWMTNKTRKEHEALNSYTHKVGGFDLPLYTTPPQRERVVFPTMLRKMWSGGEVQAWLDENVNKEKNHG
jgi:hypothetical protein